MIHNWLITGDTHGDFSRFKDYDKSIQNDPETAIIILGDAGINWTLLHHDVHIKNYLNKRFKFNIYCVRGNHDARPQDVPDTIEIEDENVQGQIYIEKNWPNIRYFKDYNIYTIQGFRVGVIGGAYSVDKWWRLKNGGIWYENEQLNEQERKAAHNLFDKEAVDFMLTHTCPITWEPNDLFLAGIDQSKVDHTMENFLEDIKDNLTFGIWCFGHYHADRLERPYVQQFFKYTENIIDIFNRWVDYNDNGIVDRWMPKSPNFWMEV